MPKRVSLRGKGAEIFFSGEEKADKPATEPEPSPPEETAATGAKKPAGQPKPRTRKAPETRKKAAVSVAPPPLPEPPSPPPVVKTPTPLRPAPETPPPLRPLPETPPTVSMATRPAAPPAPPRSSPLAEELATSTRYDRLAHEIDTLYELAARKIATGRGVGQAMQWLRDARRLVMTGKASDFAQAELLVREVNALLKHGDDIDQLYAQVLEQAGDSPDLVQRSTTLLHKARKDIMRGRLADLIEAEYLMEEVKGILMQVQKSQLASRSWGTRLLWVWLMGWLVLLLAVFICDKPLAEALYKAGLIPTSGQAPSSVTEYMLPWLCLVWGAVGAVFDTLVAINEHMAQRTYDGHYVAQGFASPMYGALLGTLIYFLFAGGLVALSAGVGVLGTASSVGQNMQTAGASFAAASRSFVLWTVAFLAGLFHKRTLALLGNLFDQLLGTLKILPTTNEEAPKPVEETPAPSAGAPALPGPMTAPGTVFVPASAPVEAPQPPVASPAPIPTFAPLAPLVELPLPPEGPPLPPEGPPRGVMDLGDL